jgi:pimeloyl-ACP methyl ester carboxylesterase
MSLSAALPQISTNVRFAASRLLFPELAAGVAERLFLTPPRARDAAATALDLIDARCGTVEHKGRSIVTWTWGARGARGGSRDAPAVLLAHGWGGNAAQMRGFVFPLLRAGYRVIAYDQPAHGVSDGKLTGLPDFADVLSEVAWHHGEVEAVIGHSLGGAGAVIALARGLRVRRVVTIGTSLDFSFFSQQFARWYWIPQRVLAGMQAAIEERFGVRWAELDMARLAPRIAASALVIHDRNDRKVPWRQGASFARAWPGARLYTTRGLGHSRILQDEQVTTLAAQFIAGRSSVAGVAVPALPHPAPLY